MCSNYRTISLISHASKILLNVLLKRMENKLEEEVSNTQAGFRKTEEPGITFSIYTLSVRNTGK